MVLLREPVRVVPLGYITRTVDGAVLTIGERHGAPKYGYTITRDVEEFLAAIDISTVHTEFTDDEQRLLDALHDSGIISLCPVSAGLPVVPMTRKPLTVARHAAGYIVQVGEGGETRIVSEIGGQLVHMIDGERTLQELVHELAQDAPVDSLLEEATVFAQAMRRVSAMTFEPAA